MGTLTKDGLLPSTSRMSGRVRRTARPLLRAAPDPYRFVEHRTVDGRRIYVARKVIQDLAMLERKEHPVETACLLFGGFFDDGGTPCAVVTRLMLPEPGEVIGTPSMVTITAEGAEQMITRAWREDPLLKPLGWGHTHPCFEAYFSHVDREEQRIWTEPASVGLVISGLEEPRNRYEVFVGPESEPAMRVGTGVAEPVRVNLAGGRDAEPRRTRSVRAAGLAQRAWRPIALVAACAMVGALIVIALVLLVTASGDLAR
jgi:proteasome lid subunit RPN8/RPN11